MLISIITPVLNGQDTIEDTIKSVLGQSYKEIEYIVIDGGSTDGTVRQVKRYSNRISKLISEKDNGIYDAMNKGIRLSSGDIIGILNADDVYANDLVLDTVAKEISKNQVDACYGDLVYVDKDNTDKVIRYWKSRKYEKGLFKKGWMPPHPTLFVRKWVYEQHGVFDLTYRFAADYELMLRLLYRCGIRGAYIPELLVKMRIGGMSNRSVGNLIKKSREDYRAMRANGLRGGLFTLALKNISKVPQFFRKPLSKRGMESIVT